MLDCLDLLDLEDVTVVVNDTAGGLLLLSLASGHPALDRIGRLVLTNCESYDQFPPDALKKATVVSRSLPGLARSGLQMQLRSSFGRRRMISGLTARGLDEERAKSFFDPAAHDRGVAGDLIATTAGFRPELLLDAAREIPGFDRPVLLIWGDSCEFFPVEQAQRLAAEFPSATLIAIPGAKTWVPIDDPRAVADGIVEFVPATRAGSPA
jgi:pimeloyl-ACP methyl ester carboxylesterase